MNLVERFKDHVNKNNLFSPKDKLFLAVSGGIDSVVLCELCKQAGYDFIIAHCNFRMRGEESERDERFVRELANKYAAEILVKKFETEKYAAEKKISIQEAARELRYEWFKKLVNNESSTGQENRANPAVTPYAWLLTAHHADDNIETITMNFFRGTGLHGLTGIPAKGQAPDLDYIRRPMLDFSREEIIMFAKENNLGFVEDSSNQSLKYTRNFFRHEIIPAISKIYPQVKENLQDNIKRFKEIETLYKFSVGELKKKLCKKKGNEIHIPVKQLMGFNNRALVYEIISEYGFSEKQVTELVKLAESESGKYIESPGYSFRIIKHRHWFIISPVASEESQNIIVKEKLSNLRFAAGSLQIKEFPASGYQPSTDNSIASMDAAEIVFPLLLRKWKPGDYFYPLGMKKKKKLSRFFMDQKLSKPDKEKAWVIEMNKKIIWIIGQRIDDRFKVTSSSERIIEMTFTTSS